MSVRFAGVLTVVPLYPALAIARAMVAADSRVQPFFIGARRGIERDVLPKAEFPFELLELHPLYRTRPWLNWRTIAGGAGAWRRIARVADERGTCALVATGGYAAGVALGFAASRKLSIVIQEQNSFPGLTVRWFAPRAAQIHLGFPEAASRLKPGRTTELFVSGNPIEPPPPDRPTRVAAADAWGFDAVTAPTLLIFGGSQGAEGINRAVSDWLWSGGAEKRGVNVIWATGPANFELYAAHESAGVRVRPYISAMQQAYAAADIALSRAGAMTTAELAAWGLPAILVPLPTAAADHQSANARALAATGAAVVLQQDRFDAATLDHALSALLSAPGALARMAHAALERARPAAAQDIAAHILSMRCFK
ncbi:MAG: UDP-N-acetylglucosamine--N-acetylmuramyl-(pentapeptide) pyrophosphoryl-undecaprenol N-acetylglucosamine transferase [Gemmatimonadaceae bacterium]